MRQLETDLQLRSAWLTGRVAGSVSNSMEGGDTLGTQLTVEYSYRNSEQQRLTYTHTLKDMSRRGLISYSGEK